MLETLGWKPDREAVEWARGMVAMMRQNAIWGIPANRNVYRFDHANKTLWLVVGDEDEIHRRTIAVFGAIGWSVRVKRDGGRGTDQSAFSA